MNPRVSRSSALASKATGFPIAKIAAKLAVGYTLDEIPNDITKKTPASFEPTIDYVVTKIPKWAFEKFPGAEDVLGTQMKSVGEVMAIGRTFKESLFKGLRSLEAVKPLRLQDVPDAELQRKLARPNSQRFSYITYALQNGYSIEEIHRLTKIDPWFLDQLAQVMEFQDSLDAKPFVLQRNMACRTGVFFILPERQRPRSANTAKSSASPLFTSGSIPAAPNSNHLRRISTRPTKKSVSPSLLTGER